MKTFPMVLGQCVDVIDERDPTHRHHGVVREVVGVKVRVVWEEFTRVRYNRWFGRNRKEKRLRGDSHQGYFPHHRVTERLQDPVNDPGSHPGGD